MKTVNCCLLATVVLAAATCFAGAAPSLLTECPAIGADFGCSVLITINPGGSLTFTVDGTQGPYDGVEDTLVGVLNHSGTTVSSIFVSGVAGGDIFALDGDGIGTPAFGWPNGGVPNGDCIALGCVNYNGVDSDGQLNTFSGIAFDQNSGFVDFGTGLPNGTTAFFSLEGPPQGISGVIPEPSSLLLLGSGIVGLGGVLRRKMKL